ncbi:MAG TPA: hypothetical protein VF595_08375 [Tepidisphaeraceae bacterium]
MTRIDTIYGVDFSGAKLAGVNAWVARLDVATRTVTALGRLGDLAGDDARGPSMAYLVQAISGSTNAVWAVDFPFALPVEIVEPTATFDEQLLWLAAQPDDAYAFGRLCVERALARGFGMHVRRETDRETKTPFDCYHYRIICQTFYGMRNVLTPLRKSAGTVIPPFDDMAGPFDRAVIEACPGSTLKRWGAPHNNYKQPTDGPLEPKRLRNRRLILDAIRQRADLDASTVRKIQRNGGGDALDAVLAAVGGWESWQTTDAAALRNHPRYRREGRIFA